MRSGTHIRQAVRGERRGRISGIAGVFGLTLLSAGCVVRTPLPAAYPGSSAPPPQASTPQAGTPSQGADAVPQAGGELPPTGFVPEDIPTQDDPAWSAPSPQASGGEAASAPLASSSSQGSGPVPPPMREDESVSVPSFGAGALLSHHATTLAPGDEVGASAPGDSGVAPEDPGPDVPSFGEGAELSRYSAELDGSRLGSEPGRAPVALPVGPPGAIRIAAPVPPPLGAGPFERAVYECQSEVYGLQLLVIGRPPGPRLGIRIQALRVRTGDLHTMVGGRPHHQLLTQQVSLEVQRLTAAAQARDLPTVQHSLVVLQDMLSQLRTPP